MLFCNFLGKNLSIALSDLNSLCKVSDETTTLVVRIVDATRRRLLFGRTDLPLSPNLQVTFEIF